MSATTPFDFSQLLGSFKTLIVVFAAVVLGVYLLGIGGVLDFDYAAAHILIFTAGLVVSKVFYRGFRDWATTLFISVGALFVAHFFLPLTFTRTVAVYLLGFLLALAWKEEWDEVEREARF